MYQNTITETSPTAETVTTVGRTGTMKEVRIQKINTVIPNRRKQKEELLCLMMKITDTGARTMDIVVGKERNRSRERGTVGTAARGSRSRRSARSAPGTAPRGPGTGTADTPSSTGSPAGTATGAGRVPHTGRNKAQLLFAIKVHF